MSQKYRMLISVAAVVIFLWFNIATYLWVRSFDSLTAAITLTWHTLTANWMSLIILTDSMFFLLLIFIWLLGDARRRGWTGYKRWGWIAAILALGSPALMFYLVLRPSEPTALNRMIDP